MFRTRPSKVPYFWKGQAVSLILARAPISAEDVRRRDDFGTQLLIPRQIRQFPNGVRLVSLHDLLRDQRGKIDRMPDLPEQQLETFQP